MKRSIIIALFISLITLSLLLVMLLNWYSTIKYPQNLLYTLKDWQPLLATILVAAGWFVNNHLNRKAEISKKRLEHRLTALKWVVENIIFEMSKDIDRAFNKPDFKEKLENARATIQIYGFKDEIDTFEEFIAVLNSEQDTEESKKKKLVKLNECIPKLNIIVKSLRKELGLEQYHKSEKQINDPFNKKW